MPEKPVEIQVVQDRIRWYSTSEASVGDLSDCQLFREDCAACGLLFVKILRRRGEGVDVFGFPASGCDFSLHVND